MASNFDEQSFLSGGNSAFIEQLYARYLNDPKSVEPGWANFFGGLQDDVETALRNVTGASWAPPKAKRARPANGLDAAAAPGGRCESGQLPWVPVRCGPRPSIRSALS